MAGFPKAYSYLPGVYPLKEYGVKHSEVNHLQQCMLYYKSTSTNDSFYFCWRSYSHRVTIIYLDTVYNISHKSVKYFTFCVQYCTLYPIIIHSLPRVHPLIRYSAILSVGDHLVYCVTSVRGQTLLPLCVSISGHSPINTLPIQLEYEQIIKCMSPPQFVEQKSSHLQFIQRHI